MRIDILVNDDGSPVIESGDLVLGDANYQSIRRIAASRPGDFRQFPTFGPDPYPVIKAPVDQKQAYKNRLKTALQADGYKVSRILEDNGAIVPRILKNPEA